MLSLSASERRYIRQGIDANVRSDGRGRLDYRFVSVQCGLLPHANGSSRVTLVNAATDVVGAVKAEMGEPSPDAPDKGRVECSVEVWASASPSLGLGTRGAGDVNAELTTTLSRILASSGALDLGALCVIPGRKCWVLYVDVVVLGSGGSIMDAISLAAYAALNDARLPRLVVVPGEGDGTEAGDAAAADIEVDPDEDAAVAIDATSLPVCVTFCQIAGKTIVDASLEEEACAGARLTVAINRHSSVCAMETGGAVGIAPASLHAALESAARIASMLIGRLDKAVASDSGRGVATASDKGGAGAGSGGRAGAGEGTGRGRGKGGGKGRGISMGVDADGFPLPSDAKRLAAFLGEAASERDAALRAAAASEGGGFLA